MADKKKVDIDVDKDVDVDVDVNKDYEVEYEKDVDIDVMHTYVYGKVYGAAWIEKVDVDVDKSYDLEIDADVDIDIEKTETNVTKNENWNIDVDVHSDNIIQGSDVTEFHDEDVNDINTDNLINVSEWGTLHMDDFSMDLTAIGDSFNGQGNDQQYDINQSNQLDDNDFVYGTTATYNNDQAPNVDASLDAQAQVWAKKQGDFDAGYYSHDDYVSYTDSTTYYGYKPVTKSHTVKYGDHKSAGYLSHWYGAEAGASASLWVDLELSAPENAFQTVEADGGEAHAGDGIKDATIHDADGDVDGSTAASADAIASAEAFNVDITAGGNQQANFATLDITGGQATDVGDIGGYAGGNQYSNGVKTDDPKDPPSDGKGGDGLAIKDSWVYRDFDDDVNDINTNDLINVSDAGYLSMEDFDLDLTAIGNAFNGAGNDMQFDVNQVNDLADNDIVGGTHVNYMGTGWNGPFQDVSAEGGYSEAGNGIGWADTNHTDGVAGAARATADAGASAEAFTASIVVGANLQVNNLTATVVGGKSLNADDVDGL